MVKAHTQETPRKQSHESALTCGQYAANNLMHRFTFQVKPEPSRNKTHAITPVVCGRPGNKHLGKDEKLKGPIARRTHVH